MRLYMSTTVPSTCVTGHPNTDPNSALCIIADQKMSGLHMWRWFGGRILTFHAVGPGLDSRTTQTIFSHFRPVKSIDLKFLYLHGGNVIKTAVRSVVCSKY